MHSFARLRACELASRGFPTQIIARWLDSEGFARPAPGTALDQSRHRRVAAPSVWTGAPGRALKSVSIALTASPTAPATARGRKNSGLCPAPHPSPTTQCS